MRLVALSELDAELEPSGFTGMQLVIFKQLADRMADTAADLSRLAHYDTGSMTRLLDRLEEKGWIRRERSKEDRRIVRLRLTSAGRIVLPRLQDSTARVVQRMLIGFSAAEVSRSARFPHPHDRERTAAGAANQRHGGQSLIAKSKQLNAVRLAVAALSSLCAAGCVADRTWHAARMLEPNSLKAERTLAVAQTGRDAWPEDDWWRVYGDAQLDDLVTEALAGSPTLQVAQARLRAAQAEVTRTSGPRLPSTALDAEVTDQRYSGNGLFPPPYAGNFYSDARLALDFSYDLDFWGRNREVLASARANARAAEADRAAARLALTVAVVRAYVNFNLQLELLDIAKNSLEQQSAILSLTQQRASRGLENIARVKQSEANVALTRASVEYVDASVKVVRAQLAALVGAGPDRGLDLQRPGMVRREKSDLPSTLPADLLGRRPDVVAQRWRVEAARHGIAAAEAAFYPNVNLAAFAGFQAVGLAKLFNGQSAIVGAGPALSLPLFNRRELRGGLQAQQAEYDLSVAQYNQTLIEAANDVATVVTNWESLAREVAQARTAQEAAQNAYSITKQRYGAGLDNYLDVLTNENDVFRAQFVVAQLLASELSLSADLVRALGGGYQAAGPPGK